MARVILGRRRLYLGNFISDVVPNVGTPGGGVFVVYYKKRLVNQYLMALAMDI